MRVLSNLKLSASTNLAFSFQNFSVCKIPHLKEIIIRFSKNLCRFTIINPGNQVILLVLLPHTTTTTTTTTNYYNNNNHHYYCCCWPLLLLLLLLLSLKLLRVSRSKRALTSTSWIWPQWPIDRKCWAHGSSSPAPHAAPWSPCPLRCHCGTSRCSRPAKYPSASANLPQKIITIANRISI